MGKHRKLRNELGFSLLEVIVIVMVLTLLAGLVVPSARSLLRDSKAERFADMVDTLRDACTRFEMDNGSYAIEGVLATPNARGEYSDLITDRLQYGLSFNPPGLDTWNGPYIDHPLMPSDNPTGFPILVKKTLTDGTMTGFDLDGSGTKLTGTGNMLQIQLDASNRTASNEIAVQVDQLIDKSNGAATWKTKGKVNYDGVACTLYIFLYQAP